MGTSTNNLLQALQELLEQFCEWLREFVSSLGGNKRKTAYDSDFINSTEIIKRSNKGFCLDGVRSLSIEDSYKGVLVFGKTGSGKSTGILIPSCLRMQGASSHIIHDPSGEIAEHVSGAYAERGYEVKCLNYARPAMGGYNPLHRIQGLSDIKRLSSLIVFTALGRGNADPFWNTAAATCLSIFIEIVCAQPKEFHTMANVVRLVDTFSYAPQSIDKLVVEARNPSLLASYKSLNTYDSKVLHSVLATVKAATEIFSDPGVSKTTSYDTIDFASFREKPTVLFINNSVPDMKFYAVITSIFFTQFFGAIMRSLPPKDALPLFFLLDEASSLNLSGIMPIAVSNIRKHRAGILQIYQSYHQMTSIFGPDDAKAIKENCFSSVYLSGQNIDTAREISAMLGQFEFETEKGGTKQRPLLTPDEVRELSEGLLIAGNLRAAKLTMRPFYESSRLRRLTELGPYYPKHDMPDEPALIPLS